MTREKDWLNEEETAEWLSVPLKTIQEALRTGSLPALHLGSQIRINRQVLLELASSHTDLPSAMETEVIDASNGIQRGIPIPRGLRWFQEPVAAHPFEHNWPRRAEETEKKVEYYASSWQGKISLQGKEYEVLIGQSIRYDRGRFVIFFNQVPICEFTQTLDGEGWASLIKPDGKKTLSLNEVPPTLYRGTKVVSYRDATGLTGIGVPKGAAVIIAKDDMRSATHQAAARWLGRHQYPVEPDL